jgi:Tetratricopeptide repeat
VTARRWAAAGPWACLLALAGAVSLQRIRSFDYWWQLRTGQWIARTGSIPRVDPYSFTVPGHPWVDIHWLHQLGLYALYSLGGHAAVVAAKAVLVGLLLALLAPIGARRARPLVSVAALGLMLLVVCDRIMPRPELPSFALLAVELALFDRFARRGDAAVYGVVALQLVWVNVHGLFALGLAVCAIHGVAELALPLVAPGERLRRARLRRLAAVILLAAAASLANPNGLEGALYPIQQLGMIGPLDQRGEFGSLIAELLPPFGSQRPLEGLAVVLFAGLAAASLLAMAANWRRLRAEDPLLWVAFLYLALGAQRNVALFAIVAAPILVRNANAWLDAHPLRLPRAVAAGAPVLVCVALLGATVAAVRGTLYTAIGSEREFGLSPMDFFYPVGAVDWIAANRPAGPICHHMADGGYLIWRLFPDYRVMSDGRLEVYGEQTFLGLQFTDPARFRKVDATWHCGVVLVHYSLVDFDTLMWWLYLNSNWTLTFADDVAAVFVRTGPQGSPWPEVDVDAPDFFPRGDGSASVEDRLRRMSRTNFWTALHRYDRALALWQDTLQRYPDLPQGDIVLGSLLYYNGQVAAAEAVFRRMLQRDPGNAVRYAQVGDLRLEAGDRAAARDLYDRALELQPKLAYALFRRAQVAELEGDVELALRLYGRVVGSSSPGDPLAQAARSKLDAVRGP